MRLWTPRDAARARRFYEREGWTTTGDTRGRASVGLPVVQYARALMDASCSANTTPVTLADHSTREA
jgi:hypothetical protein